MSSFLGFETIHYSLNLADDSYTEPGTIVLKNDLQYYVDRERMLERKVEFNDKLKAIQLLGALDVDDSHKCDIVSKIDFN